MRTRRNVAGLVVAVVVALVLAGCVPPPPHVIPTSEPSSAPVFASNAAALAAAKKAFAAYLAASDQVANDGGTNVDRLASMDSPAQLARDKVTFAKLRTAGEHTSGMSNFSHFTLQSAESSKRGFEEVAAYACIDISQTQLLDAGGNQINAVRPSGVPLILTFVNVRQGDRTLLLDRSVTWDGRNFCS